MYCVPINVLSVIGGLKLWRKCRNTKVGILMPVKRNISVMNVAKLFGECLNLTIIRGYTLVNGPFDARNVASVSLIPVAYGLIF
jgi:hypothetical protein